MHTFGSYNQKKMVTRQQISVQRQRFESSISRLQQRRQVTLSFIENLKRKQAARRIERNDPGYMDTSIKSQSDIASGLQNTIERQKQKIQELGLPRSEKTTIRAPVVKKPQEKFSFVGFSRFGTPVFEDSRGKRIAKHVAPSQESFLQAKQAIADKEFKDRQKAAVVRKKAQIEAIQKKKIKEVKEVKKDKKVVLVTSATKTAARIKAEQKKRIALATSITSRRSFTQIVTKPVADLNFLEQIVLFASRAVPTNKKVIINESGVKFREAGKLSLATQLTILGLEAEGLRFTGTSLASSTKKVQELTKNLSTKQKESLLSRLKRGLSRKEVKQVDELSTKKIQQTLSKAAKSRGSTISNVKIKGKDVLFKETSTSLVNGKKVVVSKINKVAINKLRVFLRKPSKLAGPKGKRPIEPSPTSRIKQLRKDVRKEALGKPTRGSVEALERKAAALSKKSVRLQLKPSVRRQLDRTTRLIRKLKTKVIKKTVKVTRRVTKPVIGRVVQIKGKIKVGKQLLDKKTSDTINFVSNRLRTVGLRIRVAELKAGRKIGSFSRKQIRVVQGKLTELELALKKSGLKITKPIKRLLNIIVAKFRSIGVKVRFIKTKLVKKVRRVKAKVVVKKKAVVRRIEKLVGRRITGPAVKLASRVERRVNKILLGLSSKKKSLIEKILALSPLEKRVVRAKVLIKQNNNQLIKTFSKISRQARKQKTIHDISLKRLRQEQSKLEVLRKKLAKPGKQPKALRTIKVSTSGKFTGKFVIENPLSGELVGFRSAKQAINALRRIGKELNKQAGIKLVKPPIVAISLRTIEIDKLKKLALARVRAVEQTKLITGGKSKALTDLLTKTNIATKKVSKNVFSSAKKGRSAVLVQQLKKAKNVKKTIIKTQKKAIKNVKSGRQQLKQITKKTTKQKLKGNIKAQTIAAVALGGFALFLSQIIKSGERTLRTGKPISVPKESQAIKTKVLPKLKEEPVLKEGTKIKPVLKQPSAIKEGVKVAAVTATGVAALTLLFTSGTAVQGTFGRSAVPLSPSPDGLNSKFNRFFYRSSFASRQTRIFTADLVSKLENRRATPQQALKLLERGRIFTGIEARPIA